MVYHQDTIQDRWQTLTLTEQLGNIGSEISRALSWQHKHNVEQTERAMFRGLELLDFTIADPRWRGRLRELTRVREVICDYFFGDNLYESTPESLNKYFFAFGLAARK